MILYTIMLSRLNLKTGFSLIVVHMLLFGSVITRLFFGVSYEDFTQKKTVDSRLKILIYLAICYYVLHSQCQNYDIEE